MEKSKITKIKPIVSVIIPSYNTSTTIIDAIESVFDTKFQNLEVVIVDDDSKDDSIKVIKEFIRDNPDKSIKLFTHPDRKNKGIAETRNYAIEKSRGKYIAFLDADDLFLPNRFDSSIPMLEHDSSIDAVTEPFYYKYLSGNRLLNGDGDSQIAELRSSVMKPVSYRTSETMFFDLLYGKNLPHTTSITVRADVFKLTGGFPPLKYCLEKPLWLKIFSRNKVTDGNVEPVSLYVLHQDSTCEKFGETADFLFDYTRAMIDAYTWMKKNKISSKYLNALRDIIKNKFYYYASNVLNYPHSFWEDIFKSVITMPIAFPELFFSFKFWRVTCKLMLAKLGIVRKWQY